MQDESTKLSFILLYYLVDSNSRLACIFIFSDNFIVYYDPKKLLSLYSTLPVYRYRAPVDGTAYSTSVSSVHGHLDVPFALFLVKRSFKLIINLQKSNVMTPAQKIRFQSETLLITVGPMTELFFCILSNAGNSTPTYDTHKLSASSLLLTLHCAAVLPLLFDDHTTP